MVREHRKNRPIDQTTIDPRFSFHCERITLMVRPRSSRWFSRNRENLQSRRNISKSRRISKSSGTVLRKGPKNRPIDQTTIDPRFSFPLRTYYSDGSTAVVALVSRNSRKTLISSKYFKVRRISKSSGTVLRDGPKNRPIDQTTIDPRFSIHCERITLMVRPRSSRWFRENRENLQSRRNISKSRRISKSSGTVLRKVQKIDRSIKQPLIHVSRSIGTYYSDGSTAVVALVFEKSRKTLISSKYFKVPTDFKVLRHRPPGWSKKSSDRPNNH